jgi:hypothetical protein
MIDKFYEFTQPVMDSFLTKNLTAEFPFDTSPEEIEVIKHNESGTLIMGRSGTGKTTCLVQKLVRNYTARKSLAGQAPIRQVDPNSFGNFENLLADSVAIHRFC